MLVKCVCASLSFPSRFFRYSFVGVKNAFQLWSERALFLFYYINIGRGQFLSTSQQTSHAVANIALRWLCKSLGFWKDVRIPEKWIMSSLWSLCRCCNYSRFLCVSLSVHECVRAFWSFWVICSFVINPPCIDCRRFLFSLTHTGNIIRQRLFPAGCRR